MNNKKRLSGNTALLLLSGIIIVLLVILNVWKINSINKITEQIEIETANLNENKGILAELKQLTLMKPELENAHRILSGLIPKEPQEYDIIEYINNLSNSSGSDFEKIQFKERKNRTNIMEMPVEFSFRGSYTSLVKLIKTLSMGERLFRIDKIQIYREEDVNSIIRANIVASTFYK